MRSHRLLHTQHRRVPWPTRRRQHRRCPRRIVRLVQCTLLRTRTPLRWRTVPSTTSRNLSSCGRRPRPRQPRQGVTSVSRYDLSAFDNPTAESCVRFERGVLNPPWGANPLPICRTWVSSHLSDGSTKSSMLSSAVFRRVWRRGAVHPQHPTR